MAAVGTVRLRIGEPDLAGSSGHKVTHVVKETFDAPQSVGSCAATRASAAFVVSTPCEDFSLRQVLNTSDSLCHVGKVYTGSGHGDVLQGMRCSLDTLANFRRQRQKNSVSMLQSHFLGQYDLRERAE